MSDKNTIAAQMFGVFNRKPDEVKVTDDTQTGGGNFFNPDSKNAANQTYRAVIKFLPRLDNFDAEIKTETAETVTYWLSEGQGKGFRYVSPKSISNKEQCIVADKYWEWKESDDARLKKLAKGLSYARNTYALIQVIKDYSKPENDGKIFLYNVPFAIQKQIKATMYPTKEDIEQGLVSEANNVFDPINGFPMVLKIPIKKVDNDEYRDYDECKFNDKLPTMVLLPGETEQRKEIPSDPEEMKAIQEKIINMILEAPSLKDYEYQPASEATMARVKKALSMLENGTVVESETSEAQAESKPEAQAESKPEAQAESKPATSTSADNAANSLLDEVMNS